MLGRRRLMQAPAEMEVETDSSAESARRQAALFAELMRECRHGAPGARLSARLRSAIEDLCPAERRMLVSQTQEGCAPLFVASRRGNAELAEYLVHVCGADLEQRGLYTVGDSHHRAPPLWVAAVEGRLDVLEVLAEAGADIDARSDSGSTAARSACFMTHEAVVRWLGARGADLTLPNHSGGTCLINAVQSARLCAFLLRRGVPVDAQDAQHKTALHYAVQEHRADTARLLLRHGADWTLKSRAGDDVLQTAALRGNEAALRALAERRPPPPPPALADASELLGASLLDERAQPAAALAQWRAATALRLRHNVPKEVLTPPWPLAPAREWTTARQLAALAGDMDALRTQALLVAVRVLGRYHKDTVLRFMHRGAAYGDAFRYQRCIDLWLWALQTRVAKDTMLHTDTCHTACALTRLFLDARAERLERADGLPRFNDILRVFNLLTDHLPECELLLSAKPVHKKQADAWDRALRCLAHLLHLLLHTTGEELDEVLSVGPSGYAAHSNVAKLFAATARVLALDPRTVASGDSLLHLSVSSLNTIKSTYWADDAAMPPVFPSVPVSRLLLRCGASAAAVNNTRSTALHVAAAPYNFSNELAAVLLAAGAHVDTGNRNGERPSGLMPRNRGSQMCVVQYERLKCLAARAVPRRLLLEADFPAHLRSWLELHQPEDTECEQPLLNASAVTIKYAVGEYYPYHDVNLPNLEGI